MHHHVWLDAQINHALFAPAIGELHGRFAVLTASAF
jgi:hypothetical protein